MKQLHASLSLDGLILSYKKTRKPQSTVISLEVILSRIGGYRLFRFHQSANTPGAEYFTDHLPILYYTDRLEVGFIRPLSGFL